MDYRHGFACVPRQSDTRGLQVPFTRFYFFSALRLIFRPLVHAPFLLKTTNDVGREGEQKTFHASLTRLSPCIRYFARAVTCALVCRSSRRMPGGGGSRSPTDTINLFDYRPTTPRPPRQTRRTTSVPPPVVTPSPVGTLNVRPTRARPAVVCVRRVRSPVVCPRLREVQVVAVHRQPAESPIGKDRRKSLRRGCDQLGGIMRLNLNTTQESDIKEECLDGVKAKTGLVRVNDSNRGSLTVRLVLTLECLKLQKQEVIDNHHSSSSSSSEDTIDNYQPSPNYYLRYVTVTRKNGSLGISVKGGQENNLPILISRIPEGGAAYHTKRLFVGDAIIKVNDQLITNACHDTALHILRNSGNHVTLLVKHYKAAAPFLLGARGKNNNNNGESDTEDGPWMDYLIIPLMMGYVTRYVQGTDKLRRNGFEVHGMNNLNSTIIHCDNAKSLSEWVKLISENISNLAEIQIKLYNLNFGINEKIEYMGWVNEGVLNNNHPWQSYCARFMIIRGRDVLLFDTPPMSITEWLDCGVVYKLYESMLRLVKDTENVDQRQNCFLLQTSNGVSRYFSMETKQGLLDIQCAWHRSICTSMMHIKSRTFYVLFGNNQQPSNLILDWDNGFTLYDNWTNSNVWTYKFSELRGSSDDHISRLKLHFNDNGCIETKELVCQDLQSLLFCVHAFLTAKVVSVDPSYLNTEGIQQL